MNEKGNCRLAVYVVTKKHWLSLLFAIFYERNVSYNVSRSINRGRGKKRRL